MEEPEVEEIEAKPEKGKTISYSQYSMWLKCPHQWKLAYIDNLRTYEDSIHTAFGSGIHHALQTYLNELYTKGSVEADALDYIALFNGVYDKKVLNIKDISSEVVEEFRRDSKTILDHILSPTQRQKHFPSRKYEVLGIELPLIIPLKNGKVTYKGYIDIALKDKSTGKIHIFDFKTSTMGWNKWQKMDRTKLDQLVLYKRFYHMLFKVPMNDIEVEFIILKRRLMEDVGFPQQRIQRFSPPTGKLMVKEVETSFVDFVREGFDDGGNYNTSSVFAKNPGKGKKNCKYCPFFKTDHCDSKE